MNGIKQSQRSASRVRGRTYARLPFHLNQVDALRIPQAPQPGLGALVDGEDVALAWIEVRGEQLPIVFETCSQPPPSPSTGPSPVARALAEMQPATGFRRDLHRALEASHRQQQAQRTLGTHASVDWRQSEEAELAQSRSWSLGMVLMGCALLWLFVGRRGAPRPD